MTQRRRPQTFKAAAVAKQTTQLYLNLWRKGFDEPLVLSLPTAKDANAFRLRLYVAIRPYRDKPEALRVEPEKASIHEKQVWMEEAHEWHEAMELHRLIEQLEAVSCGMPDGTGQLTIRRVELNIRLADIAAQAGIPWGFTHEMEESQKRMMEALKDMPGAASFEKPDMSYAALKQEEVKALETDVELVSDYVSPINEAYERKALEDLQNLGDIYND